MTITINAILLRVGKHTSHSELFTFELREIIATCTCNLCLKAVNGIQRDCVQCRNEIKQMKSVYKKHKDSQKKKTVKTVKTVIYKTAFLNCHLLIFEFVPEIIFI